MWRQKLKVGLNNKSYYSRCVTIHNIISTMYEFLASYLTLSTSVQASLTAIIIVMFWSWDTYAANPWLKALWRVHSLPEDPLTRNLYTDNMWPDLWKGTLIRFSKCAYFKEAYFRNSMRNLNQTQVFYGGGIAAAMTWKWSLSTVRTIRMLRGGVHGICDQDEFFEKWHYYEGVYL